MNKHLIYSIFCILSLWSITLSVSSQTMELPAAAVELAKTRVNGMLAAPYLKNGPCETIGNFANWQNVELQKCNYSMAKDNTGAKKYTTIVVHVPTANQLARWIVATCIIVKGSATTKCIKNLAARIRSQSGAQFPVAGIVFEDMDGDGFENTWNFRDGVTVVIDSGIGNGSKLQPTQQQIDASLTGNAIKTGTGGFARIQGTTREEYVSSCTADNNCGTDAAVIGKTSQRKIAWTNVVRRLYQAALQGDRNELMIAWARANKAQL